MSASQANLAALIGSRICHDLISPIGAINNGIELLGMAPAGPATGPEMALISESVENASARIRFFRVAYGAAGQQVMGAGEVGAILRDLFENGRISVPWPFEDGHPRRMVRLVFLAIQCLETAMPFGGRVEIAQEDDKWTVRGRADKLNMDSDLWALLSQAHVPDDLKPAQVQFALLPAIAADEGRRITVTADEREVAIRF